ncbi:MAG: chemotaxis protein CheB [Proteobacteria bacterium]|nr:chemotaxis protein CheB [Pseudomonadota bacterium]MBU1650137.1 chemotaxis protein CheB [Pseudomonadota bacterium]
MTHRTTHTTAPSSPIKVLIADDSWVFRRILRDIFKRMQHIQVIDDAANGIEALEQIIKFRPDVLILDMEMPIMDGLTTLQHLMIHTPTPTIIFSSLSQDGTARSFDALKYGAVDFVAKSSFFKGSDMAADNELIIKKVTQAATITVKSIDPMQSVFGIGEIGNVPHLVFCEDCGTRNVVDAQTLSMSDSAHCSHCGDEIKLSTDDKFRRLSYAVVMGAGEGGYVNLLQIIPYLSPEMGGAVVVVIHDEPEKVSSFVEYLGSISGMKVVRGQDGLTMEGGSCYIFSGTERVTFSPYSGHYVLRVTSDPSFVKQGAINTTLMSLSPLLKERVVGIVLSGSENDGVKGMDAIGKHNGTVISLDLSRCLCKDMSEKIIRKFPETLIADEQGIVELLAKLDRQNRQQVVTA